MSPLSDDICEQHVHDRNIKRGTTCKDHMPISYLVICRHLIHRSAYYHPFKKPCFYFFIVRISLAYVYFIFYQTYCLFICRFIIIVSYTPFVN